MPPKKQTLEQIAWLGVTAILSAIAMVGVQRWSDSKYDTVRRVEALEQAGAARYVRDQDTILWLQRIDRRLESIEDSLRRK